MNDVDYASRVQFWRDLDVMDIDMSNLSLDKPRDADEFYDVLERMIEETGKTWYFLTNYENCVIGPAAAPQFGFRRNLINADLSKGSVRYPPSRSLEKALLSYSKDQIYDANVFETREQALARIEELKAQT